MTTRNLTFALTVVLWMAATVRTAATASFVDVTDEAGITFVHTFGDQSMSSILEATGSGCAFFDYDGDGWMDLYALNGSYLEGISEGGAETPAVVNELFRNTGEGRFDNVTGPSGIGDAGYGMGCTIGDYDNDGDADLYVTNYGRNKLYESNVQGPSRT